MITPDNNFWDIFRNTEGALSTAESLAIMNIAAQAPTGNYIELGSYKLKSSMSAFIGLRGGKMALLEPLFSNEDMKNYIESFLKSFPFALPELAFIPEYSVEYLSNLETYKSNLLGNTEFEKNNFSYVFIDSGSHQDGLPMQEVKLLEDRIVKDGIIAFHDFKSQFIEVVEAYNYLLGTGKYEEIIINWQEIIEYVNANNLEANNRSWHHRELANPCFVGAVKRK